jgi:hypothetical protein
MNIRAATMFVTAGIFAHANHVRQPFIATSEPSHGRARRPNTTPSAEKVGQITGTDSAFPGLLLHQGEQARRWPDLRSPTVCRG